MVASLYILADWVDKEGKCHRDKLGPYHYIDLSDGFLAVDGGQGISDEWEWLFAVEEDDKGNINWVDAKGHKYHSIFVVSKDSKAIKGE